MGDPGERSGAAEPAPGPHDRRLATALDALDEPVFVFDEQRRLVAWNRAFETVTGREGTNLAGTSAATFVDDDDVDRVLAAIDEVIESGCGRVEATLETADGERVPYEFRASRLHDDGGIVGVGYDITERRERERKLDRLRERSRALMTTETVAETAQVAVDAAHEIIGTPLSGFHAPTEAGDALEPVALADTVPQALDEPLRYPRDAPPGSRAAVAWAAFDGDEPLEVEDTEDWDGLEEPTPVRSLVIHPVGDHGVFVVSAREPGAFTTTDTALLEILATSLTAALDRVERERRLRERGERLERQNERLEQFASVVSHDLRTPLSVAEGRLELAREAVDDGAVDDQLGAVAAAHDRMERLVEDLLTLAREGEAGLDPEPVALEDLLGDCWAAVGSKPATLRVDTDAVVRADRGRLRQLLENLLRNAVEHGSTSPPSQAQGDAVEHGGEGVTVTVGWLDGDESGFYVADDGPGIPPGRREEVFEPGHTTGDGGTGFGLSIVAEVARAHGWDVRAVESETGGARIEVTGVERVE